MFDQSAAERGVQIDGVDAHCWHAYLPRVGSGQGYGISRPRTWDTASGLPCDPRVCSSTTHRGSSGSLTLQPLDLPPIGYSQVVDPREHQSDESQRASPAAAIRRGDRRKAPTRIGSAWLAISVAVLLGICLIDFLAQNTESVKIEFFSAAGRVPVVVALLAAAVAGALVVLVVGIARTAQLRRWTRRGTHAGSPSTSAARHQVVDSSKT